MWQREQRRDGSRERTLELLLPLEATELGDSDPVMRFDCFVDASIMTDACVVEKC